MSEERGDYAVLVALATREEAEVVASVLRADGVDAFIGNTGHLGMNWFYLQALGGLQIFVPRDRLGDARMFLRERIAENADAYPEDRVRRRDRWKIWTIVALLHGVNFVYMLAATWSWPEKDKLNLLEWINVVTYSPF